MTFTGCRTSIVGEDNRLVYADARDDNRDIAILSRMRQGRTVTRQVDAADVDVQTQPYGHLA